MGYAFHRQCCAKYARFIPTESSEIPAAIARWLQSSERIRGVGGRALLVELGPLDRRHGHRAIRKFPQLSLSVRLFRRCGKRLQRAVREGRNSTNPLSLVILDAEFPQLCELDIPDRLDDYGMMVVPEGIALLDKWLSDKEKTCYQILEYNEKDHYKSALRAVWRLGGRASGK